MSTGELISTETFLVLCRKSGLSHADLEEMTFGMCLDFIYENLEMNKPANEKSRRANQTDFDSF